ncbi:esterase-like activity of phytase family protein [Oryzibacter oryziterrae]|uniref:esterase-like activity of phytase family protein n=1 Tax=Oryzibacter oryziterrae TaxID=2766474 RepID=UPI001F284324|nr:esterase-like activity of phytase family protein [Oryzibacter oryziterrae]
MNGKVLGLALAGLLGVLPAARADDTQVGFSVKPFSAFAIGHPETTQFGKLEWVGGFEVDADSPLVGGLSGLVVPDQGGSLLSQSDDGLILRADIVRRGGVPVGLANGLIRRMRVDGRGPLVDKATSDTESIDLLPGGFLAVSFEERPQVMIGKLDGTGLVGPLKPIALPKETSRLIGSKGLESLAALPAGSGLDGTMLVLAERAERKAPTEDQPGWVLGGKAPFMFRVHRSDDFDLTDAKVGPDGRLYVLERRFGLLTNFATRIRRFSLAQIKPGATIDGEVLFEADIADQIDNMEGLSVWRTASGETRISLISDDNRTFLERTLYLEFRLTGS